MQWLINQILMQVLNVMHAGSVSSEFLDAAQAALYVAVFHVASTNSDS